MFDISFINFIVIKLAICNHDVIIPNVNGVTLQRHHDKQQDQKVEAVIENVNLEEGEVPFHPQHDLLRHHAELEVVIDNGN